MKDLTMSPEELAQSPLALAFANKLRTEGFEQQVLVTRPPGRSLDSHAHPFEAWALVLSGQISICAQGVEHTYRAGEEFHLQREEPHDEHYGPDGVVYWVGRR